MEKSITLKDQISTAIGRRFIDLTDKHTFEKELSFALQILERNPSLKKATVESNIQAVMNVANIGLSLNPVLKLAYLVPRTRNNGKEWITETHLEPSYQGLCKLVTDTGSASSIQAHLVYQGDDFLVELGSESKVKHVLKFASKTITHVYCIANLHNGNKMIEVMNVEEINDIRERSESFKAFKAAKVKSCVWESDYGEMARKTIIRRAVKYLPKTEMWDKLGEAVNLDELDYKASDDQINYIESLLLTAVVTPEESQSLYREMSTASAQRASEIISYLRENQLDPIQSGQNYSQSDINKKLKTEI